MPFAVVDFPDSKSSMRLSLVDCAKTSRMMRVCWLPCKGREAWSKRSARSQTFVLPFEGIYSVTLEDIGLEPEKGFLTLSMKQSISKEPRVLYAWSSSLLVFRFKAQDIFVARLA